MNLNSFDDVAKHIANENAKLSEQIVNGFKIELAKSRDDMKSNIDTLSHNLYSAVKKVENTQSGQQTRIEQLEDTVARMQRVSELVITGVPVVSNESCINIVAKIASVIKCCINIDGIRTFRLNKTGSNPRKRRLRSNDNDRPPIIIVKFPSAVEKYDFFSKYLAFKNLNLTDVGFAVPQRIFIKENLTPTNYKIFQACENAKRSGQIDKYFTRDGLCHISLQPNGKPIVLHSLQSLHDIVNTNRQPDRMQKPTQGTDATKTKRVKKAKLDSDVTSRQTASTQQCHHQDKLQQWSSLADSITGLPSPTLTDNPVQDNATVSS